MKVKSILGIAVCLAAVMLTSCGNGAGSTSSSESLFGTIPSIYEKKQVGIVEKMKIIAEGKEAEGVHAIIAEMKAAFDEAGKKAQPLADKMVRKSLPYSQQEGLPYRIASDIKVEKVLLPELGLFSRGEKGMRLKVKFYAVITVPQEKDFRLHYLIMNDKEGVGYGCISGQKKQAVGDTLHVEATIYAPDVPVQYQETCNLLKFVSEESYVSERKTIDGRQKRWNDEMKERLGIKDIKLQK